MYESTPLNDYTDERWTWGERLLLTAFVLLMVVAGTRLYGCSKPVAVEPTGVGAVVR